MNLFVFTIWRGIPYPLHMKKMKTLTWTVLLQNPKVKQTKVTPQDKQIKKMFAEKNLVLYYICNIFNKFRCAILTAIAHYKLV